MSSINLENKSNSEIICRIDLPTEETKKEHVTLVTDNSITKRASETEIKSNNNTTSKHYLKPEIKTNDMSFTKTLYLSNPETDDKNSRNSNVLNMANDKKKNIIVKENNGILKLHLKLV